MINIISQKLDNAFYILVVEDELDWVGLLIQAAKEVLSGVYGVHEALVVIDYAESRNQASDLIRKAVATRPGRGYDAYLCDLSIPAGTEQGGLERSTANGFQVIKEITETQTTGPVIVISAFGDDVARIKIKEAGGDDSEHLRIAEWLSKNKTESDYSILRAKLQRCLVPLHKFNAGLREAERPIYISHPSMLEILREFIFQAKREHVAWPLVKMLLLGPMGCGKGAMARAFWQLLPDYQTRPFVTLNCASVVRDGHGGRVSFFGAEGFGGGLIDQPGVFELASHYEVRHVSGLAESSTLNPEKAGVVFLDEFVELDPALQASILNVLEEGEVRREGSGKIIPICCHVVLATNRPVEQLAISDADNSALRHDLLDRIPLVFEIPALLERRDEIPSLLRHLVQSRLRTFDNEAHDKIEISASAKRLLDTAVMNGVLKSMRKLQSVADVLRQEHTITDANFKTLFTTAAVLDLESQLGMGQQDVEHEATLQEMAEQLKLPKELGANEIPVSTRKAINYIYRFYRTPNDFIRSLDLSNCTHTSGAESVRVCLLLEILAKQEINQVSRESDATRRRNREKTYEAYAEEILMFPEGRGHGTAVEARRQKILTYLFSSDNQGHE